MIKGWKHIKPFVEAEPRIAELAKNLDLRLFWRGQTLWAGRVQLTFEYELVDGEYIRLDSVMQKAAVALSILQLIEKARREWPSLPERAKRTIDRFEMETAKPNSVRPMYFLTVQDDSLDSCTVFGGGSFYGPRDFDVSLDLVGQPGLRGKGPTLNKAVADLRARAEREYGAGASPVEMAVATNDEVCR